MRAAGNDRLTGSFRVDCAGPLGVHRPGLGRPFRVVPRRAPAQGRGGPDRPRRASCRRARCCFEVRGARRRDRARLDRGRPVTRRRGSCTTLGVDGDRERARFGAWYELFPRSWGGFAGVEQVLPELAKLGFDVVYLPPIHPIGRHEPQGPQQRARRPARTTPAAPGRSERGQAATRRSIPELGTIEDFDRLVAAAGTHGLEIALDFAIQCSPDHPWLKRASRVVPPPARRDAQVRGEPAEALPGHLQRQLRQRGLAGAVGGAPRRRPALGRARGCGSSASTTRTRSRCRSGSG